MLLADWRVNGAPEHFFVLVHPSGNHLTVLTVAGFESLLAEVRGRATNNDELALKERGINEQVRRCNMDGFGRLALPPDLMAKVGIKKQGVMVGRFTKFEIWPPDKFQTARVDWEKAKADALSNLESL